MRDSLLPTSAPYSEWPVSVNITNVDLLGKSVYKSLLVLIAVQRYIDIEASWNKSGRLASHTINYWSLTILLFFSLLVLVRMHEAYPKWHSTPFWFPLFSPRRVALFDAGLLATLRIDILFGLCAEWLFTYQNVLFLSMLVWI